MMTMVMIIATDFYSVLTMFQALSITLFRLSFTVLHKVGTVMAPILQMKKLGLGGFK